MSAIGKAKTKMKTGISTVTESPMRAATQVGIGIAVGVIIDLIVEWMMWSGLADWVKSQDWLPNRLEGITIFPQNYDTDAEGNTIAWMSWDDVFLLIVTIGMFVLGWFKKGMLYIVGFTIGWYLSSYFGLYGSLLKPALETEVLP